MNARSWPTCSFRAMGCTISLHLALEGGESDLPFRQVRRLFEEVEQIASRFRPDSELSRLNSRPEQWVRLSPRLWEIVALALQMAEESEGSFDPTLLNALEAAGYSRSFERLAGEGLPHPAPRDVGRYHRLRRRPATRALWLPAGVRLDLGGIAKGYTAHRAVALLQQWGPCLVDAGGDVVAGAPPPGLSGWPVALAAPLDAQGRERGDLALLHLAHATLATSGVDYRHWQVEGRHAHHLIDPHTGRPAQSDLRSVTVLHPEAIRAEGWATATLVRGARDGLAALKARGIAALLTRTDRRSLLTPAMRVALHL